MNPSPLGDEELHKVQPENVVPPSADSDSRTREAPVSLSEAAASMTNAPQGGRFTFVASLILIAIAFSLGFSYFLERRWEHGSFARAAALQPEAASLNPVEVSHGSASLTPDMLRVTSVSLGAQRLAIVNGKKVAEGDALVVQTPSGAATVHVTRVEDGVVRFDCDGKTIDVKVDSTVAQTPPL